MLPITLTVIEGLEPQRFQVICGACEMAGPRADSPEEAVLLWNTRPERTTSMTHELKIWPEYFEATKRGDKTFEVRLDDRDYQEGDFLRMRPWSKEQGTYLPGDVLVEVRKVFRGDMPGVKPGYVLLTTAPVPF